MKTPIFILKYFDILVVAQQIKHGYFLPKIARTIKFILAVFYYQALTFHPEKETTILLLMHISIACAVHISFTFAIMLCRARNFCEFSNLDFISAHLSVCPFLWMAAVWTTHNPFSSFLLGVDCEWDLGWALACSQFVVLIRHDL